MTVEDHQVMLDLKLEVGSTNLESETLTTAVAPPNQNSSSSKPSGTTTVHLALALTQLGYAGYQILTRTALVSGINPFLFSVYRNLIAFMLLGPAAIFLERKVRPKMTMMTFLSFNLLALTGIVGNQQLFIAGLSMTSPLFAAVSQNMVPVFTFLLAAFLGLEEVCFRRMDGLAKIVGTVICLGGALTISLYKGVAIYQGETSQSEGGYTLPFQHFGSYVQTDVLSFKVGNLQLGGLCLVLNCVSWAVYLTLQAPVLKRYPALLTVAAYTQLLGSIQVAILGVICEGKLHFAEFRLTETNEVISVLYAGIIASCINLVVQTWCVQKAGAFIVSLYNPFQMLMVSCMAILILGDPLYLGLLLGGTLMVGGFYLVVYGQRAERQRKLHTSTLEAMINPVNLLKEDTLNLKTPLLA